MRIKTKVRLLGNETNFLRMISMQDELMNKLRSHDKLEYWIVELDYRNVPLGNKLKRAGKDEVDYTILVDDKVIIKDMNYRWLSEKFGHEFFENYGERLIPQFETDNFVDDLLKENYA